jgi:carbon-monoxide dehydrogenase large subunit
MVNIRKLVTIVEEILTDGDGQLLTGTLIDHVLPKADCVPAFEIGHLETPSPAMPGGVKGMGAEELT